MIFGYSYLLFNRKISNFRGHFVSLESKFRGYLKQNLAFLRDRENPGDIRCSLIWDCTVCSGLSVQKQRIAIAVFITVPTFSDLCYYAEEWCRFTHS